MKPTELRALSLEELNTKLVETKTELRDAERSLAAGELANPRVITKTRRDIARLKTILAEQTKQTKENNNG